MLGITVTEPLSSFDTIQEKFMKPLWMIGAAALTLTAAPAFAQSTYSQSTTTTTAQAPVAAPPPGTLSTSETKKEVDANGDTYESHKTTYGDANGAVSESHSVTVTRPQVNTMTTRKSTTTTSTSN
ncbi:MAG: hypothetical protein B7Z80_27255 [Rhodospirillales bacterium 20-64-7]|nr:MAG: hypothetical protein B7Z80_27255 [Rhodospirillales bacterium 20-64-7]